MKHLCLLLGLLLWCAPAAAQTNDLPALSYNDFNHIPILHDGRIKPLDSFARTSLRILAGKDRLPGISPSAWLAEMLFDPAEAVQRPSFYVTLPEQLGLPLQPGRLYSYAQLAPVMKHKTDLITQLLSQNEKDLDTGARMLLDLHRKSIVYTQLLRSFSGMLPLAVTLPDSLRKEWKISPEKTPRTLNEFTPYLPRIETRVKKIVTAKGDDLSRYSDSEKEIATLGWQLQTLEQAGAQNTLLRIIPPQWGGNEWLSPWALTQEGKGAPDTAGYLALWTAMAASWQHGDNAVWEQSTRAARDTVLSMENISLVPWKLSLEVIYNDLNPVGTAMLCYLMAFIALIMATLRARNIMLRVSFATLLIGALVHAAGIITGITLLGRPPVGTLYESILFVSLICVIGGLIAGRRLQDTSGLLIAALSGSLLLFTARAFTPDDSLQMLVAVLNTNFWLATHVLCITIGYGWCLIAAIMAHLYLFKKATGKTATLDRLQDVIKTTVLCALLFTAVGTILGGIWADQSWGRFWGWDPKENGALLIVLWLIWLLHGRISGQINRLAFMAGTAALSIVVGLSWFGVNLLGTGLHSYGFIEGVAAGLFVFCLVEGTVITSLWYKARHP
jgi:ABC-type transport system involved in cytochrome c biogenesis permease subunit